MLDTGLFWSVSVGSPVVNHYLLNAEPAFRAAQKRSGTHHD